MARDKTLDADVAITIAFYLYAFVFGLAGGVFVLHAFRKTRANTATETARGRGGSPGPEGSDCEGRRRPARRH